MAKFRTWNVDVDGKNHEIGIKIGVFRSTVKVDDEERQVKSSSPFVRMIDEDVSIGGKDMHLTALGNHIDLAVNGVYENSRKAYVPLSQIPGWANVMVIVLMVVGWLFFGIIGMAIGILGGTLAFHQSLNEAGKVNVVTCVGIYLVTMAIQIVGGLFVNGLL